MTAKSTPEADDASTLTDPTTLRDRDDVEFVEKSRTDDEAHFENHETWDGLAVIGVTDEDALLLQIEEDGDHGTLPHFPVLPGEDYAAVARRAVEDQTGIAITIDGVERVRKLRHSLEGDDDRRTTVYHVVFRASPVDPAGSVEPTFPQKDGWTADWFDDLPENPTLFAEEVLDDVRLFLD